MPNITIKKALPLHELVAHQPGFAPLQHIRVTPLPHRMWQRGQRSTCDLQVAVLGKTGYGKSSLVNALVGKQVMETSAVAACTRHGQSVEYTMAKNQYFSIADFPGIGESAEEDAVYRPLYDEMLQRSDLLVYVLRADQRDWAIDEAMLATILPTHRDKTLLVLNACDKVEPIQRSGDVPGPLQQQHIQQKIVAVQRAFPDLFQVLPCSVATRWNLSVLVEAMVQMLLRQPGVA